MPDLTRFFSITTGLLRPGGRLVDYETHTVLEMFDPHFATPDIPAFSYFDTQPHIESGLINYNGRKAATTKKAIGSHIESAQS